MSVRKTVILKTSPRSAPSSGERRADVGDDLLGLRLDATWNDCHRDRVRARLSGQVEEVADRLAAAAQRRGGSYCRISAMVRPPCLLSHRHRSRTCPSRSIVTSMAIPGETRMAPVNAPDRTTAPASSPRPSGGDLADPPRDGIGGMAQDGGTGRGGDELPVRLEDDPDEIQRQVVRCDRRPDDEAARRRVVRDDVRQREPVVAVAGVEDLDGTVRPTRWRAGRPPPVTSAPTGPRAARTRSPVPPWAGPSDATTRSSPCASAIRSVSQPPIGSWTCISTCLARLVRPSLAPDEPRPVRHDGARPGRPGWR